MDSAYLQAQRFQLQKRFRRLNSCEPDFFHSSLIQFWNYLMSHPMHGGTIANLSIRGSSFAEELTQLTKNGEAPTFATEAEADGFAFRVIEHCAQAPLEARSPEVNIGRVVSNSSKYRECLDAFIERYLEPFYEFLDESLDQKTAVLSLLLKYKRRAEWFERAELAALLAKGERSLAQHLYAYLFDQGLDFHIEPKSASGEADLVAEDLVLDAKIFDGARRGVGYLKSGVNQVLTYTRDFNQTVGYVAIYKTCPEDLHFDFAAENTLVPFLHFGGKTLFFLVIDLCDYEAPASKRGTLKAHVVTGEDLRQAVDSGEAVPGSPGG